MKELLSPAGNFDALIMAISSGANAVYLSGKSFGARKYANNFTKEELKKSVLLAHLHDVKIYVTVNIIIYQNEVEEFLDYIEYLYNIGVDALIMQDIGMISLISRKYPNFEIHASTQVHNHNNEGIKLLKELGVTRVVLDREMTLDEIENIKVNIEKEVFVHGALCNCYSGCCLFSSMNGGRSGNRGECVQSCRLPYKLMKNNKYLDIEDKYLLSTKELNTTPCIKKLLDSNIESLKIEGRMKSPAYVGYVTKLYRKLIDKYCQGESISLTEEEEENLKILFNRGFTTGYLFNDKILNTSSSNHQGLVIGKVVSVNNQKIKIKLTKNLYQEDGVRFYSSGLGMIANKIYNEEKKLVSIANKGEIIYLDNKIGLKKQDIVLKTSSIYLEKKITSVPMTKIPIDIEVSSSDNKLFITFTDMKKNKVSTTLNTMPAINRPTGAKEIEEKITKLGSSPFKVGNIYINIDDNIFVSMKLLNEKRRELIDKLIEEKTKIKRKRIINEVRLNQLNEEEKTESYEISVLARTDKQVEAALQSKVDRIYMDEKLYKKYKKHKEVYLRLPRVINKFNYECHNVLATELGAVHKYKNYNLVSDYYLNVVNNHSINFLLNNNVKRVTLSPEVNYDTLPSLLLNKAELIVYGRIELMITKSCILKEVADNCPCSSSEQYFLVDQNKNKYPIIHDNCLTHIMHYKNIDYLDKINYFKKIGVKSYRLELFDEKYNDVIELIKKIRY